MTTTPRRVGRTVLRQRGILDNDRIDLVDHLREGGVHHGVVWNWKEGGEKLVDG